MTQAKKALITGITGQDGSYLSLHAASLGDSMTSFHGSCTRQIVTALGFRGWDFL